MRYNDAAKSSATHARRLLAIYALAWERKDLLVKSMSLHNSALPSLALFSDIAIRVGGSPDKNGVIVRD